MMTINVTTYKNHFDRLNSNIISSASSSENLHEILGRVKKDVEIILYLNTFVEIWIGEIIFDNLERGTVITPVLGLVLNANLINSRAIQLQ